MSSDQQLKVYSFTFSQEKGKKALVRFRENLRKYYSHCGLTKGLGLRDEPYLQLFCYDPATDIGYCRLTSSVHDGPMFPSPKKLYETYNCSCQGHLNDIFLFYDPSDEDNGKELTRFLEEYEIIKPSDFSEEAKAAFTKLIEENKLLKAYDDALEEKRQKKAADSKNNAEKKKVEGNNPGASQSLPPSLKRNVSPISAATSTNNDSVVSNGEGKEKTDEENASTKPAGQSEDQAKKKPGRPKGSKGFESSLKRQKTESSGWEIIPTTVQSLDINDGNLDNVTANFTYRRNNVRFGDLPQESMEKSALCWNVFSFLLDESPNESITIGPNVKAEDFLRAKLLGYIKENNDKTQ